MSNLSIMSRRTKKFGFIFGLLSLMLVLTAVAYRGWYFLLLWPGMSFAIVSWAYLGRGCGVFGKRPDGTLAPLSILLLLPYLLQVQLTWHLLRLLLNEPPFHELTPQVLIGRRLLSRELPPNVHTVIDLTCEFAEPKALRATAGYISFPILDGESAKAMQVIEVLMKVRSAPPCIFIHCAQGHGRTGMIAAAWLLLSERGLSTDEAIARVCFKRPGVRLKETQDRVVCEIAQILAGSPGT